MIIIITAYTDTHSCAAYIASLCSSGFCVVDNQHLINTVSQFNNQVATSDAVTIESLTANPVSQRVLSGKLESHMFCSLLEASSIANKAGLLAVSAPHAASWIAVVPSVSLGLHLDPSEFQVAIKWWLGMEVPCVHFVLKSLLTPLATMQYPVSKVEMQ